MGIVLGPHQYGKAETRLVRIYRDGPEHQIRDLNVSTSLRGDFAEAHLHGDQAQVLPTDTQKNTAYAFAMDRGVGEIEEYALALARHFAEDVQPVQAARVDVEEYLWERISVGGTPHPHAFVRSGQEVRTAAAIVEGKAGQQRVWVLSGLRDLILLKSTGSEFAGFLRDRYTTLAETHDRVLATSLVARWRYVQPDADWSGYLRWRPPDASRTVRHGAQPRAPAEPVGDGQSSAGRVPGDSRDQAVGAEQASFPG